jgi:hypothetical protein
VLVASEINSAQVMVLAVETKLPESEFRLSGSFGNS